MTIPRVPMLRGVAVAVLRAGLWASIGGALITLAVWLRTSAELRPGFAAATWFGLAWALAFVPSLAMELGVFHLLLEIGTEERAPSGAAAEAGHSMREGDT